MKRKGSLVLLVLGGLALTGCAKSVDNIDPEADRQTKDEVYAEYLTEKYGEEYPDMSVEVGVDYSLRLCSVLDGNTVTPADLDVWLEEDEGLAGRDLTVFKDMLYTGVKVYCPDNLGAVEHLRPVTV